MSYAHAAVSSDDEEQDWSDWDEADDAEPTQSLFCTDIFPSARDALDHDTKHHGFDLRQFIRQGQLTEYDTIRCINFIRKETAAGRNPIKQLDSSVRTGKHCWDHDEFMRPTLQDDALLFYDFDQHQDDHTFEKHASTEAATTAQQGSGDLAAASATIQQLQDENMALRDTLQQMSSLGLPVELASDKGFQNGTGSSRQWQQDGASTSSAGHFVPNRLPAATATTSRSPEEASERINEAYFDSYGFFGIHREMLSDKVRTEAYRDAILKNPSLMKDAKVLDVGCGTGILSMFAAKAGASQVIGVDGSKRIAEVAERLVSVNGLGKEQRGPISIVQGRLEQLAALPAEKVDVIVSEWMGYALLFEAMLDTVLYARDRWLKPGGAMLPDIASIHLAAAGPGATGLSFWQKVYGFDYSLVQQQLLEDAHKHALVKGVSQQDLLSTSCCVCQLDLATMTSADCDFSSDFVLEADAQLSPDSQQCQALVLWFDTDFSSRFCSQQDVKLSTSPHTAQTHWCQTILVLREPVKFGPAKEGKEVATALKGRFSMARSDTHRGIDMSVEYAAQYADGSVGQTAVQIFSMTMSSNS